VLGPESVQDERALATGHKLHNNVRAKESRLGRAVEDLRVDVNYEMTERAIQGIEIDRTRNLAIAGLSGPRGE
jgi:hypothetical protein